MTGTAKFIWNELITEDLDTCGQFPSAVFGSERTETYSGPLGLYTVFRANGEDVAGMMRPTASDYAGSTPPRRNGYRAVTKADEATATAERMGGKNLEPPHNIPGVGRIAIFTDSSGALVYVMQPTPET